jgi:hypothetical protein
MAAFEYRQAREVRDALARHGVRYLFIGKSGAILLGFPDTTQDADLFVDRRPGNGRALAAALRDLGFGLTDEPWRLAGIASSERHPSRSGLSPRGTALASVPGVEGWHATMEARAAHAREFSQQASPQCLDAAACRDSRCEHTPV